MTAESALLAVAGLRPGQTALIHAAAGGVGLAALQVGSVELSNSTAHCLATS